MTRSVIAVHSTRPREPILGATLLVITPTAHGVVVGCPGCGAQQLVEPTDEPQLEHGSPDCPVFQAVVVALKAFIETSGGAWLM
jgi:hypothetical protein